MILYKKQKKEGEIRMTVRQWVQWGSEELEQEKIENASQDAWYLFEFATGMSKMDYLLEDGKEIEAQRIEFYQQLIEKRKRHIPLQHLTGVQEFMGYEFMVNASVLTPRQDTETLVEEILFATNGCKKLLDLCTGSGCIALSLALLGEFEEIIATDLSKEALAVAKQNMKQLFFEERRGSSARKVKSIEDKKQEDGIGYIKFSDNSYQKIQLLQGDLFEAILMDCRFDVIVSNPPYIETKICETLMPEVREHEPRMALDGHEDGLYFYRKIIEQAKNYLEDGGWLFFEIGYNQGKAVKELLKVQKAYEQIQVKKDLAGLDRIVSARYQKGKKTRELSMEET